MGERMRTILSVLSDVRWRVILSEAKNLVANCLTAKATRSFVPLRMTILVIAALIGCQSIKPIVQTSNLKPDSASYKVPPFKLLINTTGFANKPADVIMIDSNFQMI